MNHRDAYIYIIDTVRIY